MFSRRRGARRETEKILNGSEQAASCLGLIPRRFALGSSKGSYFRVQLARYAQRERNGLAANVRD
jgi:hypothetical protein